MSRYSNIADDIIDAIAAAGFDVYQPEGGATYLHFTDGKNIGYLQKGWFGGFELSTVHIPNKTVGTGYKLDASWQANELTREHLSLAFMHAPSWVSSIDRAATRKWPDAATYFAKQTIIREIKVRDGAPQERTAA